MYIYMSPGCAALRRDSGGLVPLNFNLIFLLRKQGERNKTLCKVLRREKERETQQKEDISSQKEEEEE